jgi:integrase
MCAAKSNLHENLPLGSPIPAPVNKPSSFRTEEIDICDGEVRIYRDKKATQIWQLSIWVRGEGKYFRKSLRTKDLEIAKTKAKSIFYKMMGQVEIGRKIFSISAHELTEKYLTYQQQRADGGDISPARMTTFRQHFKHFLDFVGADTKLDTIENKKYRDYYLYRRRKKPDVKNTTLINERSTLTHMYKWGLEEGHISQSQLPVWAEIRKIVTYRKAFQREEYRVLYTYIRNWTKNIVDERELYNRELIRDFILVLANTGMRFGEARFIKWNYVELKSAVTSEDGRTTYPNVHIHIPKEISKVKKDRTAIGMRGDIFQRIKTYSKHTHQQDYVFADVDTGEPIGKKILYRLWNIIRKESGIGDFVEDYSYYSLRHTFATYRLQFGNIDVFTLAKIMGVSVKYIEAHYGQIQTEKMTDYITRTKSTFDVADKIFIE